MRAPSLLLVAVLAIPLASAAAEAPPAAGAAPAARDAGLLEAVRTGDAASVAALLDGGADVNEAGPDGTTALHWAVYRSDVAIAERLISLGAAVDAANRYGVRPLTIAAAAGHAGLVELLLDADADPALPAAGEPPILSAARTGSLDTVRLLVRHGADINATETLRGQTALMWAAAENHAAVVRTLLELGADVHARSTGAGTVRSGALDADQRAPEQVTVGFTPILFAARQGALDAARVLVAAGANVNEQGPRGSNALLIATRNHHYELAAYLVARGADPNAADAGGATALHAAVRAETLRGVSAPARTPTGVMDRVAFVDFLLDHGANPNARLARDARPRTADTRDLIADRVIDFSVSTGGATPFFFAAKAADVEVMRLLVDRGAHPRITTYEGTTPLAVAAGIGFNEGQRQPPDAQVLEALALTIALGNDLRLANVHGQTPLHGAVYRGLEPAISLLIDHDAPLDAIDGVDRTPLKLAEEGFFQLASRLRRDGAAALLAELGNDTPEQARLRRLNPTPR